MGHSTHKAAWLECNLSLILNWSVIDTARENFNKNVKMEMQENVIEKLLNKFDDSTTNLNDIIATLCDEQECFEAVVETIQMEIEDLKTLLNDFDFFVKTQREANMKCRVCNLRVEIIYF